jgi:rare lipoprotein A
MASWYGVPYHGQRAASGEIYDQEKLTAAHRTLPFGTRVRVRSLDRDISVVVRINDRGPFVKSRIIDVSHAAAVRLGMTDGGIVRVTLEVVELPPTARAY